MTGIDKIIGRIEADALLEAERIMADAKAKADEITAEYQKKADALSAELKEKSVREAEARRLRAASNADMTARKMLLETKQALITKVFDTASEKLSALPEGELVPVLARIAADASRTGREELILSSANRGSVGKAVVQAANKLLKEQGKPAALTLSERTLNGGGNGTEGGLILSGGEVELNCTFEAVLDTLRGEMAADIAGILFN